MPNPMTVEGAEALREELQHRKSVLRPEITQAIAEAPDGTIWLGTYGGGINRLDADGFTEVPKKPGLPRRSVSDVDVSDLYNKNRSNTCRGFFFRVEECR